MQIFFSYIKRLLLSPLFYLAIVMVSVICWFGMQEENARPGVIYAFDLMLDISSYRKLMMLFATIPFGTVYCKFYFVSFLFVKAFVSLSGDAVCILFSHCVFGNFIVHRAFLHTRHTVLL